MSLRMGFYIDEKQNSVCVDSVYSDSYCGYVLATYLVLYPKDVVCAHNLFVNTFLVQV
jgi:hypothetical protein